MGGTWLLALAGLLQPVLLVLLVPRRWLGRAMAIWLALPIPVWAAVVLHELATREAPPHLGQNLALGFGLVMTTYGAAWVVASGIAFLVGLGLRRLLRPAERQATLPPPRSAPLPAAPAAPPQGAVLQTRDSPDGRIRVGLAAVEWFNTHWVHAPRVEDRASGAVLLDLWGTDWDARVDFPAPGQVRLGLRRYRGPGAWALLLDLGAGTALLRDAAGGAPLTMPIAEAAARLEAAAQAAMVAALPVVPPPPRPFAAWRTAVVILLAALAAIGGLTWWSLPPKALPQVLDKLPAFPPAAR